MADIFISYSSKHRDLTRALAEALEAQGYSVWWDKDLEAYASFRDQIDAALSQARVVVVIWSEGAVASDYVVAEAREALTRGGVGGQGRLVNTIAPGFDPTRIPKPMSEFQAEKVEDLQAVMRAIAKRWAGEKPERLDAADFFERATGKPALSTKRESLSTIAHVTPALLLNARVALAPYLDAHGLRAELNGWAREGRPVRGRLIHGPGGLGKTRLMVEVCANLRPGWAAGFVETPDARDADIHRQAIEHLIDSDRGDGLLLVLDYAERRQDEAARYADLMLKAAQHRPGRRLRLVLLARAAGEWWDRAVEETPALTGVFTGGVTQMADLAAVEARAKLFEEAGAGFRTAIEKARAADPEAFAGWDLSERSIPERLRAELVSEDFARPLMIQIAALLHLRGETLDATSTAALLDGMLGLERAYWKRALGDAHTDQRRSALARGTIQTTLVGGASKPDAEALLLKDAYYARAAPADVAEPLSDLERLYGDGAGNLVPLEPDLVGEHLAAADGDTRIVDACLCWAGEDAKRRRDVLTVLQRATRVEHGAKADAAKAALEYVATTRGVVLMDDLIDVALKTPGDLPAVLERAAIAIDPDAADAFNRAIPKQTLRLMKAAAALAARACAGPAPTDEPGRSSRAGRLSWLGIRLSMLGRREEALTATQEAVEIYRKLSVQSREAFLPDLAASLNNLGRDLSNLGRREEALAASLEAVEIRRELSVQNRDAFLPALSSSLNSLGVDLSNLGRREEALVASAEAAEMRRELAAQNRDAFLPDLAMSLNNLGIRLSTLGRREEALAASAEAVEINRELSAQNRDAFLPDLASSLNNLGIRLSSLGHREEALAASAEAVEIYRELSVQNRDAFLPDLASSLNNLGIRLSSLGRREEALLASAEAVEIRRELSARNRDAFLPDLAASLTNLGADLSNLGRREEALGASAEAVEMYRELSARNRDAFLPDLAMSLNNHGAYLSNLGFCEEALAASAEAVEMRRELTAQNRDAFLPDLAGSLNNLGADLSNLGRREEALTASAEAVEINRELSAQNRDAFLPDLASSLNNLGIRLSNLGRREEALTATQEAVEIYRELSAQNRDAFLPDLARSLLVLGTILLSSGRKGEAVAVHSECATLLHPFVEAAPGAYRDLFAANLRDLVEAMRVDGRSEAEIAETLARYGADPAAFAGDVERPTPAADERFIPDPRTPASEPGEDERAESSTPKRAGAWVWAVAGLLTLAAAGIGAAIAWGPALGFTAARDLWTALGPALGL
jgi:tetratricopeptide (TPR) repeat protein